MQNKKFSDCNGTNLTSGGGGDDRDEEGLEVLGRVMEAVKWNQATILFSVDEGECLACTLILTLRSWIRPYKLLRNLESGTGPVWSIFFASFASVFSVIYSVEH